jgi:hypothetical protein
MSFCATTPPPVIAQMDSQPDIPTRYSVSGCPSKQSSQNLRMPGLITRLVCTADLCRTRDQRSTEKIIPEKRYSPPRQRRAVSFFGCQRITMVSRGIRGYRLTSTRVGLFVIHKSTLPVIAQMGSQPDIPTRYGVSGCPSKQSSQNLRMSGLITRLDCTADLCRTRDQRITIVSRGAGGYRLAATGPGCLSSMNPLDPVKAKMGSRLNSEHLRSGGFPSCLFPANLLFYRYETNVLFYSGNTRIIFLPAHHKIKKIFPPHNITKVLPQKKYYFHHLLQNSSPRTRSNTI